LLPGRISTSPAEIFPADGAQGAANFAKDFVFSERLGGGAFVQVGFHELRIQGQCVISKGHGVLMVSEASHHAGQVRPAEFVRGIQFKRLFDTANARPNGFLSRS